MKKLVLLLSLITVFAYSKTNAQMKMSGGNVDINSTPAPNAWTKLQSVFTVSGTANSRYYSIAAALTNTSYTTYGYGVSGTSYSSTALTNGRSYGVYGLAGNCTSGWNYGVYGIISGSNNGAGVYGTTNITGAGDTLIPGKYAGYFKGNFRVANLTAEKYGASTWTIVSDSRLKTNITPFQDGLNIIRKINPVNYNYNGKGGLPTGVPCIGVIAQQVKAVAPYCVGKSRMVLSSTDSQDFSNDIIQTISDTSGTHNIVDVYNYNQDGLFYAMLNSIKQLDSTVTSLQKQLSVANTNLQQQINNCCSKTSSSLQKTSDITGDIDNSANNNVDKNIAALLYQNTPNPFSQNTTIKCYIPSSAINANIFVYDMQGTQIKKVQINGNGNQNITIQGSELKAGMYMYTLIIDGKEIGTKKMILTD